MVSHASNGGAHRDPLDRRAVIARAVLARSDASEPRTLIRVLLIDPRPLTARAVRRFLETVAGSGDAPEFAVTAVSCPGEVAAEGRYDVLLLHVSPTADVATEVERCLGTIPAVHRAVPAVVFSDCGGAEEIAAAVRGGARGFLPSTLDCGEIVEALRLLASGLAILPPDALARLVAAPGAAAPEGRAGTPDFTEREHAVLRGLRDGKPNKVIARELAMSLSTVKVHVRSIFRKLGANNRTEAALAAGQVLSGSPRHG